MGMVRAPYPARIAAGLVVTAIEETRKLPTLVVTVPMTAVSQTVQAGMRMQQNIAELAIKGDLALEMLFDRPVEEPEWARFDEDDDAEADTEAARTPIESAAPPKKKPEPRKAATKTTATKKTAAKKTAAKKTAATKSASQAAEKSVTAAVTDAEQTAGPDASAGRFALYSAPPEDLVGRDGDGTSDGAVETTGAGEVPEIVEYIEYDNLTLAQLRAKLRGVGVDELEALVAYERATKSRAPFVTMIDNRIAAQNSKRQPST